MNRPGSGEVPSATGHGSHPARSPPCCRHGAACPPKGSVVDPSPWNSVTGVYGKVTPGIVPQSTQAHAWSPRGVVFWSLTFAAADCAIACIDASAVDHVLPASVVQR